MGCPASCVIGDNLTFSVCCHDPDTGVLTDADSVPTYRIYEEETATAILTGSMAKLDDSNTTGFYTETIAVTTGNGFENGKTYTIYIEATVDSDKGGISFSFKAVQAETSGDIYQLLGRMAPTLIGTVTGAGTGTEAYVYNSVTVTITADEDGNVTNVVFS